MLLALLRILIVTIVTLSMKTEHGVYHQLIIVYIGNIYPDNKFDIQIKLFYICKYLTKHLFYL